MIVRVFVFCSVASVAACGDTDPQIADQAVRPVKLFKVTSGHTATNYEFVGRIDALQTLDVSFEVAGELVDLPAREGQTVEKGDLIAALQATNFELAVREAEVRLRLATQELKRKQALAQKRAISQSLADQAQAEFDLSEVSLALAKKRLSDSRLYAPFKASVARRYIESRTKVSVGDHILRLSDLEALKVVANVREQLVATISIDRVRTITARFDFAPDREFPLEFLERSGEASATAQTYEVTFTMPPPEDMTLLPGMTATIRVELKNGVEENTIVIPTTALVADPDGNFCVWVFDPETNKITRRQVVVTEPLEGGIGISSGLEDSEIIAAAGANQLQEGMVVRAFGELETRL